MAEKENKLLQFGQDALDLYGNYYIGKEGAQTATDLGQRAFDESSLLATDVAGMAEFKPFTVTTGLGTADVGAQGGYALNLSPEQQAMQDTALSQAQTFMSGVGQDPMQRELLAQARQGFAGIGQDPRQRALLSQADTAFGRAMADPRLAQADLYEQMRAVQRPEEQRQSLALEERMLSQGRMGFSSSAYGGSSPELLALQTAREEAKNRASLSARQQAMAEQQQALQLGTGMMTQGYVPQQQALAALGYGVDLAKLPLTGQTAGAEMFGQLGQTGLESQIAAQKIMGEMTQSQIKGMFDALFASAGTEGGFNLGDEILGAIFKDDEG
jgi:hypothetical protein